MKTAEAIDHPADAEPTPAVTAGSLAAGPRGFEKHTFGQLLSLSTTWQPVEHIATGFPDFDGLTGGGLRVGGVHILAGDPGSGKTQIAVQIGLNAALRGIPVGLLSLEQPKEEIVRLIAAKLTGIPRHDLDQESLSRDKADLLDEVRRRHAGIPLVILDDTDMPGGLTRKALKEVVERGHAAHGWRLVIIDYLGLLAPEETDRSEFDTDVKNSSILRSVSKNLGLALLAVAAFRKTGTGSTANSGRTLNDVLGADGRDVCVVEAPAAATR